MTLEKDDQLATLREEVPAAEVDAAALQLQLRPLVPPLPPADPPSRSAPLAASAAPAALSSDAPLQTSAHDVPPLPTPSLKPPAGIPSATPPPAAPPSTLTSTTTVLSQPRSAVPVTPPVQKPALPVVKPVPVTKPPVLPSAKPPLVPPAKPVAVSKPPPVVAKPPPPVLPAIPVVKPTVPAKPPLVAKHVAKPAPSAPAPAPAAAAAPTTAAGSTAQKPLVIDVVSPMAAELHPKIASCDDELCNTVPLSPTRPPAPPTLFETDELDDITPEEMAQLAWILDGKPPPKPSTPPPAPENTSVDSPGLNDSLLKPMLSDVPCLITPGAASAKAPIASSMAQADTVLIFTPPVADDAHPEPESDPLPAAEKANGSVSMAEAKAIIARNPKPLEEWSMEEMTVALQELGVRPGSRQFMRYKLQQIAGIDPSTSFSAASTSNALFASSAPSRPLLVHSLSSSSLVVHASAPKSKPPKEKACSDVDMDLKITQLIKSSSLYEQMLQYEVQLFCEKVLPFFSYRIL